MKLYILVKDSVPDKFVPVICAHASLMAHLRWDPSIASGHNLDYTHWLQKSFKKVVCKVSDKEFEHASTFDPQFVVTESALQNQEVARVLCPREEWPKALKFYKLWEPKEIENVFAKLRNNE